MLPVCLRGLQGIVASRCTDLLAVQEQDPQGWNKLERFRRPLLANIIRALTSTTKRNNVAYKKALGAGVGGQARKPVRVLMPEAGPFALQPANGASAAAQGPDVTITMQDVDGPPLGTLADWVAANPGPASPQEHFPNAISAPSSPPDNVYIPE